MLNAEGLLLTLDNPSCILIASIFLPSLLLKKKKGGGSLFLNFLEKNIQTFHLK